MALSACNTGRQDIAGTVRHGEGAGNLARAFMYAGTPAVSMTLWSVGSESAKTMNAAFFKNLSQKGRAEALRDIKRKMIAGEMDKHWRHPFFWAPLVVFGEGQ